MPSGLPLSAGEARGFGVTLYPVMASDTQRKNRQRIRKVPSKTDNIRISSGMEVRRSGEYLVLADILGASKNTKF
jgi:hypothetical protein